MKHKTVIVLITLLLLMTYSISFPAIFHFSNPDLRFYALLKQKYPWLDISLYCIVIDNSIMNNIDPVLICSLIHFESGGKKTALSNKGARGLMQLMACHLKGTKYTIRDLYKPSININLGCRHFAFCKSLAKGNLEETLRLYNQGHNSNRDDYKNWKYVANILNDYFFIKNTEKNLTPIILNKHSYLISSLEIH